MSVFERILLPVDGSEFGDRILLQVRRILLTESARVFLVRVVSGERAAAERVAEGALHEGILALDDEPVSHLQRLRVQLEREGIHVEARLLTGEPAAVIVDLAEEIRPSLIAMSTHGRSGITRWIRGSVAERVLHGSRFPLLMANPFAAPSSTELGFRRILVPLDGSRESGEILPLVHDLARTYESEVVLAHVLELPPDRARGGPLMILADEEGVAGRFEAESMLAHSRESLGGLSVRLAVLRGQTAAEVIDLAERENFDLVALTTHGRSGVSRWLFGSVADRILRHARMPTLVLRTGFTEVGARSLLPSWK